MTGLSLYKLGIIIKIDWFIFQRGIPPTSQIYQHGWCKSMKKTYAGGLFMTYWAIDIALRVLALFNDCTKIRRWCVIEFDMFGSRGRVLGWNERWILQCSMAHGLFLKLISATKLISVFIWGIYASQEIEVHCNRTLSSTRCLAKRSWTSKIGELKGAPERTNLSEAQWYCCALRFVHPDLGIGGAERAAQGHLGLEGKVTRTTWDILKRFFFPQVEAHFTCGTDSYGGGSCFHCWSSSQRWEDLGHRHGSGEHPPRRLVVDAAVALQNHGHEVHGPEIDGFSAIIMW